MLSLFDLFEFMCLSLLGLLKFFGGVCQHKPDQVLSQHPEFVSKLFSQMSLGDTIALETTAFIAKGASGKRILNSNKGFFTLTFIYCVNKNPFFSLENFELICLHLTGSLCHSTDTNQRVTGFFVAADLFHLDAADCGNNELSSILKCWWNNLGLTWNYLLEQLHQPFENVKIGIHVLLANALPHHSWMLYSFNNSAGFMEYLMGRQTGM